MTSNGNNPGPYNWYGFYDPHAALSQKPNLWERAREALTYINPDCEYGRWIRVGMAIHSEFGEHGRTLWDSWSQGAPHRYVGKADIDRHWNSFEPTGGISIRTLFREAAEDGWKGDWEHPEAELLTADPMAEVVDPCLVKEWPYDFGEFEIKDVHTQLPDGLIKELFEYLDEWSVRNIPEYPLAGALAFGGFLRRNMYQISSDSRTNLMVQVIGESGTGKTRIVNGIKHLLDKFNMLNFVQERLVSIQGIQRHLKKEENDNSLFYLSDEEEVFFSEFTSKDAPQYVLDIFAFKLSTYSNTPFIKEHSTKESKDEIMKTPFFDQLTFSTPTIIDIFPERFLKNGFFPRCLMFLSEGLHARRPYNDWPVISSALMAEIAKCVTQDKVKSPLKASLSLDAKLLKGAFEGLIDKNSAQSAHRRDGFKPVFDRGIEQVLKIAMLFLDPLPEKDRPEFVEITESMFRLAAAIWIQSSKTLYKTLQSKKNDNETALEDVLHWIKINGEESKDYWIEYAVMSRNYHKYTAKPLRELVDRLVDDGYLERILTNKGKRGKTGSSLRPTSWGAIKQYPKDHIKNKEEETQ